MDILARRLLAEAEGDDPICPEFANALASAFQLPVTDISVTVSVLLPGTSVMMDVGDLALAGSIKSLNVYPRQGSVTGLALLQGAAQAEWTADRQVTKPPSPLDWFVHHRRSGSLTLMSMAIPSQLAAGGVPCSIGAVSLVCPASSFNAERHGTTLHQLAQALAEPLPRYLPGFFELADLFLGLLSPPVHPPGAVVACRSHSAGPGRDDPGLPREPPQRNVAAAPKPMVETRTGAGLLQAPVSSPEPALELSPANEPKARRLDTSTLPESKDCLEVSAAHAGASLEFDCEEGGGKLTKEGHPKGSLTGNLGQTDGAGDADEKPKANLAQDPLWLTFLDKAVESQFIRFYAARQCENDALALLLWMGAYGLSISLRSPEIPWNPITRVVLVALILCARDSMLKSSWYVNNRTIIILAVTAGHNFARILDACWWVNEWTPDVPPPVAWQLNPLLLATLMGIALDSLGLQLPFAISAWSRPVLAVVCVATAAAEGTLPGGHPSPPGVLAAAVATILIIALAPIFVSRWCEYRARESFKTAAIY